MVGLNFGTDSHKAMIKTFHGFVASKPGNMAIVLNRCNMHQAQIELRKAYELAYIDYQD